MAAQPAQADFFPCSPVSPETGDTIWPAARAAAGLIPSGLATGGRARVGRRRGRPPLPLSLSNFSPLSLFLSFIFRAARIVPAARPATMAGRTSCGRTPRAGGGHRRPPRSDEAPSPPPTSNQRGSRFGSRLGEGPPALSSPSLTSGTPPDAASGAGGAAGQVSGPARRRARRRARTKIGTDSTTLCSLSLPGSLSLRLPFHGMAEDYLEKAHVRNQGESHPPLSFNHPREEFLKTKRFTWSEASARGNQQARTWFI